MGASGSVRLGPNSIEMAPPGLVNPPTLIPADSEFTINFQQPLSPEQVASFRQWEAQGADITMMFGDLAIMTKAKRWGHPERLSLWDGISLRNGRFLGRIVSVSVTASLCTKVG